MNSTKFLRECLVFCLNETGNRNNHNLKNYLLNTASDNEVLSYFWSNGKVVTESFELPEWSLLPFHILAGGALSHQIEKLMTKAKMGNAGKTAEIAAGALISYGASLLAKNVYALYKRATDACTKKCLAIRKDANNQERISVCYHQCKIQTIQQVINKLRIERSMCGHTQFPEKCMANIDSQIIKYQTELQKEMQKLNRAKYMLINRLRHIPSAMSMKPSTEKWRSHD